VERRTVPVPVRWDWDGALGLGPWYKVRTRTALLKVLKVRCSTSTVRAGTARRAWAAAIPKPETHKSEVVTPFQELVRTSQTRNPKQGTRNPKPETRNPKHGTRNPKLGTRNQKPEIRNPTPET
jgi:hypothetical protein